MEKSVKFFLLGLIVVFLAIPAFHILAQDLAQPAISELSASDGSGVGAVETPARATSSPVSSAATESTTTPSPIPTFQEPSSTPPQFESEQDSPISDSGSNAPLLAVVIVGAAALGFGLYKMMQGRAKPDNKNDDKNNKCNLIKATLDQKMKELTDLEGRIAGKIKGTIKDTIEGALLTEEEKIILNSIEGAKAEYEKLKALYEECIIDVGTGKTKTLKFRAFKADMILKGEKTSSLRLFDDKDLKAGDELELINWDTKKIFGKAKVTEVIEKKLGEIADNDLAGHEPLEGGAVENLKKYYGEKVSPETTGKIVRFKLEK